MLFLSTDHLDILDEESPSDPMTVTSAPAVHIIPTLATVGNGLELKCGLATKGAEVVWRRHGVNIRDLAMIELLVSVLPVWARFHCLASAMKPIKNLLTVAIANRHGGLAVKASAS